MPGAKRLFAISPGGVCRFDLKPQNQVLGAWSNEF
ncbi:hypothetical protein SPHI_07490 [Sphingomonas jeddahensis]|uniref:Uncharacterized protein n=1 Tax=Sphingomonas jeddahensis TaxID=1915074 RepID=A0A1V2EXC4_9SPHN|nr:hypothetical protein SPHI_07490 [Sphingomonas jeddahensis]